MNNNNGNNGNAPNGGQGGIDGPPCGNPLCQRNTDLLRATIHDLQERIRVLETQPGRHKRDHKIVRWGEQQCLHSEQLLTRGFTQTWPNKWRKRELDYPQL